MDLRLGDVLTLKKPHPCGGYTWEVLRVGLDFRLKCATCGHMVMIPRLELERRVKKVERSESSASGQPSTGDNQSNQG
jgi:hypothetical protein